MIRFSRNNFGAFSPNQYVLNLLPAIFIFIFAGVLVPFIGPIFLFLLPVVIFINAALNGIGKTSIVFFASFALLMSWTFLLGGSVPALAVLTMGMAGLCLAAAAGKNFSAAGTLIYPSSLMIGAVIFHFIYDAAVLSVHPWSLVKNYITLTVEHGIEFYASMPLKTDDIDMIRSNQQAMINGFVKAFPSMVVIVSVFTVWINLLIGKKYLSGRGVVYPKINMLARWKIPEKFIWVFIMSGALLFVSQKDINFIGLNIFLIACLIYALQGFAIISFLFQNRNVPVFLRHLFYFLIAVQQILVIPIITIGLFDVWIDFRKIFQKNNTAD